MPWRSAPGSPPVPLVVDFSDVYKQVNPCGKAQKVVVLLCASTWAANAIGFALPIFIGQSAHRVVVGCGEALRCTVGEVLERQDRCEDDVRWEVAHEHSLASEWDLTCDRESMLPVAGTAFFFGNLFGNLVLSTLMDRLGASAVLMPVLVYRHRFWRTECVVSQFFRLCRGALRSGRRSSHVWLLGMASQL